MLLPRLARATPTQVPSATTTQVPSLDMGRAYRRSLRAVIGVPSSLKRTSSVAGAHSAGNRKGR